ncbi:DUF6737 family protein [Moorena producens]|uniref:DUF6737 family protein n=1 Tax=Moorena producens TaxID=1155739 RepID=UPI0009F64B4E|nr:MULTISPECIES: DUF6737 family protein [Moorena]
MSTEKKFNPWSYKPWWCQPWSILLTGSVILLSIWVVFKTIWITLLAAMPIMLWWTYFLLIWPELIKSSVMSEGTASILRND